jgi:hypothetical protein
MNGELHQKLSLQGVKELSQSVHLYSPLLATSAVTIKPVTCSVELD